MPSLASYIENLDQARNALLRYGQFAESQNWSIRESKLHLYRRAKIAFGASSIDRDRPMAFESIYSSLQAYWQVFRGSPEHWSEERIYDVLSQRCTATSRMSDMSLATDLIRNPHAATIVAHLEFLRKLKIVRYYPTMAVSKFSHFFNPALFPIYDDTFISKKVIHGVFRQEWNSFVPQTPPGLISDDNDGIWDAYYWIAWASEIIRRRHPDLMTYFSEWFVEETKTADDDIDDLRIDLRTYYATAFEFIAIGAAHIEE